MYHRVNLEKIKLLTIKMFMTCRKLKRKNESEEEVLYQNRIVK